MSKTACATERDWLGGSRSKQAYFYRIAIIPNMSIEQLTSEMHDILKYVQADCAQHKHTEGLSSINEKLVQVFPPRRQNS